jgi:hypothetical protein
MSDIEFSWASEMTGVVAPVYMAHAYQSMLSVNDCSDTLLLQCMKNGAVSYIPMLVKDLGEGLKEAYSAYGYGGLLGGMVLSEEDIERMRHCLAAKSILALFVRHSPFLSNQSCWPSGLTELNRYTYATRLRLSDAFDAYVKEIPQKMRWSVNYALRAGLRVNFRPVSKCSDNQIQVFYKLYSGLMQEKQTSSYYLFSEDFFLRHGLALGEDCEFAEILHAQSGKLLAGAFFMLDRTGWVHYHLSAAFPSAMRLQAMELLIASAMQRYGNMGYQNMHLGGGHALDESDGLSRFKSKFATDRLEFFYTKLVCDRNTYEFERARVPLNSPKLFLISDARNT